MKDMPGGVKKQLKSLAMPEVEVVTREGKPTSIDDHDPFMQFLMLASSLSQQVRIRKYYDDRESQGWTQDFKFVATDDETCTEIVPTPGQSISITNKGLTNPVHVSVNAPIDRWDECRRTLDPKETYEVNFETHKISCFFVQCPPGLTTKIQASVKG
jgi:hypothetical protein